MPYKNDQRHAIVGHKHRARARYAMIQNRLKADTKKNAKYKGVELRVTKEEFVPWFQERDFPGCSVDRIRAEGHYELGNLQVIPGVENAGKDKRKARDGECVCRTCQQTKQLTEFVKESRRMNGYSTQCRECERKRAQVRKRPL